jgi:Zn-dependent metalloprotease
MKSNRCSLHCIVPPHIFEKMMESDDVATRHAAFETLLADTRTRGIREVRSGGLAIAGSVSGRRTIFDARQSHSLGNAVLLRSEGDAPVADESANRLYDGLGATYDFFSTVFGRDSIDDNGHPLDGYVHVGNKYNNATFDGRVMRFGDGDGARFADFTLSLDVIAHELSHGVTFHTADLVYEKQPGALNESMSDVFGSLVKQWGQGETAEEADWLIGTAVFTPGIGMDALRSVRDPGSAYDHPIFGRDPQPGHMDNYFNGSADNFGVHINSGIPNRAFFETASLLGGHAWEIAGHIWYAALLASGKTTQFQEFADRTYLMASEYGSEAQDAVAEGWRTVGILLSGLPRGSGSRRAVRKVAQAATNDVTLDQFSTRLEELARLVASLAKEVQNLRPTRTTRKKRA